MTFIATITRSSSIFTRWFFKATFVLVAVAAYSQTGGKWTLQSPLPTGAGLQGVAMISATEAWAVGGIGTVIHTTDGGAHWKIQPTGINDPLYSVRFLDAMHGWIGSNNTVLYTTNGGKTWKQGAGVAGSIYGLGFADLKNGFAAGGADVILRTRDGGHNWTRQQVPIVVRNFRFFDAKNGVAVGDGVLHTSDGGDTWTVQKGSKNGGFFIDPNEGWYVLNHDALHTTDGGSNWDPEKLPKNAWVYSRYFTDSLNGWAVGAQQDIIHTADGGNTWKTQMGGLNSGNNNLWTFWDTQFTDPLNGMAVGDDGLLFTTVDGGKHWKNRESGTGTEVFGMSGTDANHVWTSHLYGEINWTNNGGRLWHRVNLGVHYIGYGVSFFDNLNGWAVASDAQAGEGLVFHSTDGGKTWKQQTSRRQLYAVRALSQSTVVAVGGDSFGTVLVRSTDGGATWTEDDNVPAGVLYGLFFLNSKVGWAVGYLGSIVKTTDGGVTWTPQNSGVNVPLLGVSFADAKNGWIVGDGGALLHTTNGGATWNLQNSGVGNNIIVAYAVSPTVAWISGYDFIARTLDGGRTWKQENFVNQHPTSFSGLYFLDADNGWAGGFNGTFRRTKAAPRSRQ